MSKHLTADEIEAIWAMLCAKMKHREILAAMAEDRAGLGHKRKLDPSTLSRLKARLIEERGQPRLKLKAGEEMSAIDALFRESIEMAGRQLQELQERERRARLTPGDMRMLRSVIATLDDAKRRARVGRASSAKTEKRQEEGSAGAIVRALAEERERKAQAEQDEP